MPSHFGRYENVGTIAAGGMATVYLGRASGEGGFERLVAIKVMHPHIAADETFRAMFLDEARLAARIRHPNVVGVLDVQKEGKQLFLVMEYVDGPSLHQLRRSFRKRNTMLPVGITLRIFTDALTGLHAAHELTGPEGQPLHLVHRDVTPQNILIGRDGVTRITDFGVARAEARITSTRGGQLKGKIAYMPVEQLENERLDARADVYSAGCALWEALAGRRLFKADSEAAMVHMIIGGATLGPASFNDDVPREVEEVCMKALNIDRDMRWPDAAMFADALEAAAAEAGLQIPSSRQLATFIRSLPDLDEHPQPPSTPSARTSLSGIDFIPTRPGVESTTTNALVAELQSRPAGGGKRWMVGVGAALALTTAGVTYFAVGRTPSPPPTTAPAAAAAEEPAPYASPAGADEPERASPTAMADEEEASPPAAASAAEAEEEPEPAAEKKTPTAVPRVPRVPVPKKKTEPAPHRGPGYNPTEL